MWSEAEAGARHTVSLTQVIQVIQSVKVLLAA